MGMLKEGESISKVGDQVGRRQEGPGVADQVNCLVGSLHIG